MIQVKISEIKNRLSFYLRLVRGGEEIEILDRKTPLARLIHVSQAPAGQTEAPWIREMEQLGIVTPPREKGLPQDFLHRDTVTSTRRKPKPAVLKALLEERHSGR